MDALMPFVLKGEEQKPEPFSYLKHDDPYTFNIKLDVLIKVPEIPDKETLLAKSNFKNMYCTMKQQLTHHTITGCIVNPGDLLASRTISGDTRDAYGSMLEISWRGKEPFLLDDEGKVSIIFSKQKDYMIIRKVFTLKVRRVFLKDGDNITIKGHCQGEGYRIGFGECTGTVLPATTL